VLLSLAGHELRTPLTVIRGHAELVRARSAEETSKEAADAILAAATRLEAAVAAILAVFALDTVGQPPSRTSVNLDLLVGEIVATLPAVPVRREGGRSRGALHVFADPARVSDVLAVLLTAAAGASGESIGVGIVVEGGFAGISVAAPDAWTRGGWFELAAFASRRLLGEDGGIMRIEHQNDRGLVTLLLPTADAPAKGPGVTVLLVDDDASLRDLLRATLPVGEGFELIEAYDGAAALEAVNGQAPDLIVLDWSMPGLSGADVLERLRAGGYEAPVVVLTAETDASSRRRAEELGADAFLTKPFSPLELLGLVEQLLERRI
jgi:CheY-like chemotaxis protein